jgi:Tetratricopeptide repeat
VIRIRLVVIVGVLWTSIASGAVTPADLAAQGKFDEAVTAYRQSIDAATAAAEKGRLHKELGDLYAGRSDNRKAAAEYILALRLNRSFPENERVTMAVRISWGGMLPEALQEFTAIVIDHPGNLEARLGRARVLSWSGRYAEAISEADMVLSQDPGNRDALLVKANCLRWQGDVKAALKIFHDLLRQEEDFDTRLGLAYTLLSKGDLSGARESFALLDPKFPYQMKEVAALKVELARKMTSAVALRYSYYSDTDDNSVHRIGISGTTLLGGMDIGTGYRRTEASDLIRDDSADEFTANVTKKFADFAVLSADAGFAQTHASTDSTFLTGGARAVFNVLDGTAGINYSREIFTETAELINNKIRIYTTRAFFSQKVADRFSLYGSYGYRDYSDGNGAHDIQFAPAYAILRGDTALGAGYRFRYFNFRRQSGSGYFDPNDFISNGIFLTFNFERGGFYLYLEPYGGYQEFRRNGGKAHDLFGSIVGSTGYRINRNFLVEVNGEYGNYAAQTANGFRYYLVGAMLKMFF